MKNRQPLSYKVPGESAVAFDAFIRRFRPLLLHGDTRALFPGRGRPAKRGDSLSKAVKKLLAQEVGIDWTAHAFRHLAVRIYLRQHPGDYEGARRLLAHLSGETTYQFYEGMEMLPAVDRYDHAVASLRGTGLFKTTADKRRRTQTRKGVG